MGTYRQIYERSLEQPEAFWAEAAEALHWDRRWDRVLDADKAPFYRWFAGGTLNTCFNAVDRHVQGGRAAQPALIYDSPMAGAKRVYTYAELLDEVRTLAGVLEEFGAERRVILWNTVPTHPHLSDKPLSNRRPTREEIAAGRLVVERFVEIVQPRFLVGVGRIACQALPEAQYVRHPAQSGATAFRLGMRALLARA